MSAMEVSHTVLSSTNTANWHTIYVWNSTTLIPINFLFPISTEFALDPKLKEYVSDAKSTFAAQCASLDVDHLEYNKFTKECLKKQKLSPDAVLQLVIQVIYCLLSIVYYTFKSLFGSLHCPTVTARIFLTYVHM